MRKMRAPRGAVVVTCVRDESEAYRAQLTLHFAIYISGVERKRGRVVECTGLDEIAWSDFEQGSDSCVGPNGVEDRDVRNINRQIDGLGDRREIGSEFGSVAEWLNAPVLKTGKVARPS